MNPREYCDNGVIGLQNVLIDINYKHTIYIEMFIYGFNNYGELSQMYENNNEYFSGFSLVICYGSKKIINKSKFINGLKVIGMNEV